MCICFAGICWRVYIVALIVRFCLRLILLRCCVWGWVAVVSALGLIVLIMLILLDVVWWPGCCLMHCVLLFDLLLTWCFMLFVMIYCC